MGCHISKQARRDVRRSPSPLHRTNSLPLRHHLVSLTSSTLGSLKLESQSPESKQSINDQNQDLSAELAHARAWSKIMDRKISRTPTETPPNEPETIDTFELMAGLEDSSAFDRHSFSFYPVAKSKPNSSELQNGFDSPEPGGSTAAADFDLEIVSAFRKALEELSPQHPVLSPRIREQSIESTGIVRARINGFQERINAKKANAEAAKGRVVVYFTSLRGVRKTYEDCCSVRAILRGYDISVDERDVSMHGGFREEMKEMVGGIGGGLPRVFVDGKDLGGAEEVRRLHEEGELGKVFEDCGVELRGKGEGQCEGCGDVRFSLCGNCSGSCKVYVEEEEEEEDGGGGGGGGWRRCSECNENGMVRCPVCC